MKIHKVSSYCITDFLQEKMKEALASFEKKCAETSEMCLLLPELLKNRNC